MHKVLILGAGNIGSLMAYLLADTGDYEVILVDSDPEKLVINDNTASINPLQCDISNEQNLSDVFKEQQPTAVVSCLPYFLTVKVAEMAKLFDTNSRGR